MGFSMENEPYSWTFKTSSRGHLYAKGPEKMTVLWATCKQKHLGMLFDFRLDFQEHWKSLPIKVNTTVALLPKFQNILPRSAWLTIYKCSVRTHLDYGDIIYDQAFNNSFHQKIESLQYNVALAITGAIRGTSREKNYQELGLESLQQ